MQEEAARPSIPTEPAPTDLARQARARIVRRLFVVALALFLALGAIGLYGVRTTTDSAAGGGYELSVTYARISRPGLATPWSFEVRRSGGFPDGLTVTVTSAYFDAFDENGLGPQPEAEQAGDERTIWRFAATTSETVSVSFDARIEPGVQLTTIKGDLTVLAGPNGPPAVTVGFKTFVMP
ncbi:MAG TPA: hypothetical protein VJ653_04770 [Acidimicrobiales bacterium]|nr:hypothetical protein [Acidimicrobiales bacterium]